MLVGSLENLLTIIMLPNIEGDFIEQKVEFVGLPGLVACATVVAIFGSDV